MVGFSSLSDLISKLTVDGQLLEAPFQKTSLAPEAAGTWCSLWRVGGYPAAGGDGAAGSGTPGAGGTALTLADGSLSKWADQSPKTKHLLTFEAQATRDSTLMLYDRLVSVSGISLVGTGNKNVNSVTLPRYTGTDSAGLQVWLEVTTATNTTAPVVSMNSYTDQDGNGTSAGGTITFPAAATNIDTMVGPLPLASGDSGVRSVETINVATAAASTGTCNLVILRPLAYLGLPLMLGQERDFVSMLPSLTRLYDGHSLGLMYMADGTTATTFYGHVRAGYG
jgi:hypothetical protein